MLTKASLFGILLCIAALDAQCHSTNFICNPKNPLEVIFPNSGHTVYCKDGKICNKDNIRPCAPCVDAEPACEEQYKCDLNDLSHVLISGFEFACGEYMECNHLYEKPCQACIEKKCPEPQNFRCGDDEDYAIIANLAFKCAEGTVCNKNYKQPCKPCINEEDDETEEEEDETEEKDED